MKPLYSAKVLIPFHLCDPAGILFFGNVFQVAHSVYEKWIAENMEWKDWFDNKEWIAPIKKAEAEYFRPLLAGETFDVSYILKATGETSFTIVCEFSLKGEKHVSLQTTQVFCDKKTFKKIPIPQKAAALLKL